MVQNHLWDSRVNTAQVHGARQSRNAYADVLEHARYCRRACHGGMHLILIVQHDSTALSVCFASSTHPSRHTHTTRAPTPLPSLDRRGYGYTNLTGSWSNPALRCLSSAYCCFPLLLSISSPDGILHPQSSGESSFQSLGVRNV